MQTRQPHGGRGRLGADVRRGEDIRVHGREFGLGNCNYLSGLAKEDPGRLV